MERPEYIKINSKYFLQDVRNTYNINNIVHNYGYIYYRIKRGMSGLKQAARLAYNNLKQHLQEYVYKSDKYAQNIGTTTQEKQNFVYA